MEPPTRKDELDLGDTLPDRQHFGLDAERWAEFQAALDAPPEPAPRLTKLLTSPSVFER